MTLELITVLLLILGAEFVNGWTDAPNAVATVVGTRALTPRQALLMASVFNLLGVMSGTAVAATIGVGIVDPAAVDLLTVGAAMVGLIAWSSLAARWGIPTSESHALVAGLSGAALAAAGPGALLWSGWAKVLVGLLLSGVLGVAAGFILMVLVIWAFHGTSTKVARGASRHLQIASSAFMAFSHGSNDGQKFIGAFALALLLGGAVSQFTIATWVILTCACVMALGTLAGGWRIMQTLGMKITPLKTHQGFAAEVAAAGTISAASALGIPVSTTHTISAAIVGVGAVRGACTIAWPLVTRLVLAWLVTFPACAFLSWSIVKLCDFLSLV